MKEWISDLYEQRTHKAAKKTQPKEQAKPRLNTKPDDLPEGSAAMAEFPLSALFPDGNIAGFPDVIHDPSDDLDAEEFLDEDWDEEDPFVEDDGPPSSKAIRE